VIKQLDYGGEFLGNGREFSEDSREKHVKYEVIFDEEYCDRALDWVHSHSSVKGKPNMVASDFVSGLTATIYQL